MQLSLQDQVNSALTSILGGTPEPLPVPTPPDRESAAETASEESANRLERIDRSTVKTLREVLQLACDELSERIGAKVTVGNAKFTDRNATFSVEIATINEDGEANSRQAEDFKRFARTYGLVPEHLGKRVMLRGTEFEIIGAAIRSPRFPILVKRVYDGKVYKYPVVAIRQGLGIH
jgi:hypothetical protein